MPLNQINDDAVSKICPNDANKSVLKALSSVHVFYKSKSSSPAPGLPLLTLTWVHAAVILRSCSCMIELSPGLIESKWSVSACTSKD